jgi:hypothetical protein
MIDGVLEFLHRYLILNVPTQQLEDVIREEFAELVPELLIGRVLKLRKRHLANVLDFIKTEQTVAVRIQNEEEEVNFILQVSRADQFECLEELLPIQVAASFFIARFEDLIQELFIVHLGLVKASDEDLTFNTDLFHYVRMGDLGDLGESFEL